MKEFIVCAAVWFNDGKTYGDQPENITEGLVIAGRRHNNCYASGFALQREYLEDVIRNMSEQDMKNHHGFITSLDRYVNRKEAWIIAKENNQIVYGLNAQVDDENAILISENLY